MGLSAFFGKDWDVATFVFVYVAAAIMVHTVTVVGTAAMNAAGRPRVFVSTSQPPPVTSRRRTVRRMIRSARRAARVARFAAPAGGHHRRVQPPGGAAAFGSWLVVLVAAAGTSAGLAGLCEPEPLLAVFLPLRCCDVVLREPADDGARAQDLVGSAP